jgi:hypothetical protein
MATRIVAGRSAALRCTSWEQEQGTRPAGEHDPGTGQRPEAPFLPRPERGLLPVPPRSTAPRRRRECCLIARLAGTSSGPDREPYGHGAHASAGARCPSAPWPGSPIRRGRPGGSVRRQGASSRAGSGRSASIVGPGPAGSASSHRHRHCFTSARSLAIPTAQLTAQRVRRAGGRRATVDCIERVVDRDLGHRVEPRFVQRVVDRARQAAATAGLPAFPFDPAPRPALAAAGCASAAAATSSGRRRRVSAHPPFRQRPANRACSRRPDHS